jgi:hypothetical protein
LGVENGEIRGQIERNWNFSGYLKMKLKNLKTKYSFVKGAKLYGWYLSLVGVQLHAIEVGRQLWVQLKGIERVGTKLKLVKSKINKP